MKKINMMRLGGIFLGVMFVLSSASVAYAKNDKEKGRGDDDNNGRFSSLFCERFVWKGHGGPKWCRDENGNGNNSAKKPLVYLYATDYSIKNGASTTMYWSALRADSCSVSGKGWSGSRPASSTEMVSPNKTTKYTITCTNQYGSYKDSATITVKGKKPVTTNPELSLVASSTQIAYGSSTVLSWNSTNTNSCTASNGWSGTKSVSGNQTVSPTATTTYTLACGNGNATSTQSVTVNVSTSTVVTPPAQNLDHVVISEVYYDVGDGKGGEPSNEWIELYNGTGSAVNVGGWFITDTSSEFDYIPAGTIIPNGGFLVVTAASTTSSFWSGTPMVSTENRLGNALGNTNESIYLKNTASTTVDAVGYGTDTGAFSPALNVGALDAGQSIRRSSLTTDTNAASDWAILGTPTPGSF